MNIFIDTETSGLPSFEKGAAKKSRSFPKYADLDKYDTCRIVSICWIVAKHDVSRHQADFRM